MVRELGPMMTAIPVSARSGSAITSEPSAMNVREEIDAMGTMVLDPHANLVLPRLAALTLALPWPGPGSGHQSPGSCAFSSSSHLLIVARPCRRFLRNARMRSTAAMHQIARPSMPAGRAR